MPAMNTNFADPQGFVSRRFMQYYLARAHGDVGLIIVSAAAVDKAAKRRTGNLAIYDDVFVDSLAAFAACLQEAGAKVFQQLNHVGRLARTMTVPDGKYDPVGPSCIPHPLTGEKCKELSVGEIKDLVGKFAQGAERVRRAGFNGLEIHGAHGYLLNQFLSPYTNRREDEYGGNLERRMRFPLEVVRAVRKAVGDDFPICYRISAQEYVPGGTSLDEVKTFAQELERAQIDVLHVSGGASETPATVLKMIPPMSTELGCYVSYAEQIKKAVRIPVIVVGKIRDPQFAEDIIQEGKVDMVAMGRALIADPKLPLKAREGRPEDIRKCIYCNQGCIERLIQEMDITCTVNPAVGREEELKILPSEKTKKVFVIGGGPGGMEAARVAALRGHRVTLFEKRPELGGQLRVAWILPDKSDIRNIVDYYSWSLEKLGVTVKTDTEVSYTYVEAEKPDAVVLATGSKPLVCRFSGTGRAYTAHQVLKYEDIRLQDQIAVIGGGQVGLEVALVLALRGHKVKVIEMLEDVGRGLGPLNKFELHQKLEKHNVEIMKETAFIDFTGDRILVEKAGRKEPIGSIKTVIFAIGSCPNDSLGQELQWSSWRGDVYRVGDCIAARNILDAIREGLRIGREI
jgi:2,4-dienoyl-CoA reductase-like NADH-dependent reductase (Old Yellow Enzyme family)/thioredoxin reductase